MSNNNYQHHKIIRPVIKIQKTSWWEYTIQDRDTARGKMWAQYIKNDSNIATIFIKTSTANHYSVSHSPRMGQESIPGLTVQLQQDRQPHTPTSTPTSNSQSPIYLTSVSLNCGKKPGLKKAAYARKEPSHCEATPPLCKHKVSAKQLQTSQVMWLLNSAHSAS